MPLVMPFDFYDPIGNRTSATDYDEQGNPLVSSYSANALNQYTQRTVPGYAALRGFAATNATVTVNERPTFRQGSFFYGGDVADNTDSSVFRDLEVYAAINPPGTNTPDIVSATTGTVFIARTPESFAYDADGNMTSDGRFHYTWNGENRLVMASNDTVVVTYAYDHRGRMVTKALCASAPLRLIKTTTYIWDNWNIIREIVREGDSVAVTDNVWGLDLDGTLQGAGGVGGLLAVVRNDGVFLPTYDANGNVSEYVSTNGEVVAHYDYSPFGEPLVASGELAAAFTHQFSTKPYCAVTGFSEYQMRKYRPEIGRWMSRDPIEDIALGLSSIRQLQYNPRSRSLKVDSIDQTFSYLFCKNNARFLQDILGLCDCAELDEAESLVKNGLDVLMKIVKTGCSMRDADGKQIGNPIWGSANEIINEFEKDLPETCLAVFALVMAQVANSVDEYCLKKPGNFMQYWAMIEIWRAQRLLDRIAKQRRKQENECECKKDSKWGVRCVGKT